MLGMDGKTSVMNQGLQRRQAHAGGKQQQQNQQQQQQDRKMDSRRISKIENAAKLQTAR